MRWFFLAIAPVFLGLFAAALCLPKNRGKKELREAFTICYPVRVRACLGFIILSMILMLLVTAYSAPEVLQALAVFYVAYVFCIGLFVAVLVHQSSFYILVEGQKITVGGLKGKKTVYYAKDIVCLNVRKNDVQVLGEDKKVLFTVGIMMENLDVFFAWTHAHSKIKLTLNGKELPKAKEERSASKQADKK